MNRLALAALSTTIVGCIAALAISVWPGLLQDVLLWTIVVGFFPAVALAIMLAGYALVRGRRLTPLRRNSVRLLAAIPVIGVLTFALLILYVPRRMAFLASRAAFESALGQINTGVVGPMELNRRLGAYLVDSYAVYPHGVVYFRVYDAPDGLGPDTRSFGFVKNPNSTSSLFGAAYCRVHHVVDDWYWFEASDDWF